ncbi:hypothetical protein OG298_45345 (plasmid) [Streptomyces sp. NBC_01005]|uniref:DUF6197 family protein n=1 Tax=Streptomyces sp. NBC_01005 TaxID=2903715 RepID=UPI003863018F|nr:hypothetical protein OG298_45345 [Streptomyces sp. NBC_01005]
MRSSSRGRVHSPSLTTTPTTRETAMLSTAEILRRTAGAISFFGLHTGEQFAASDSDALDVCAAIYLVAESGMLPAEFKTDENVSLAIIGASAPAMAAIRTLSGSLITPAPYTEIAPGLEIPDYIEHVSSWATTKHMFADRPPTVSEVIGALHRAAQAADALTALPRQTERSAA